MLTAGEQAEILRRVKSILENSAKRSEKVRRMQLTSEVAKEYLEREIDDLSDYLKEAG